MLFKYIFLLLLMLLPSFGMDVQPTDIKSQFSVKCFGIMQPLLQDIAAKKLKIDQCDETIQNKDDKLSDMQSKCDRLNIRLAVAEAVVREKERQVQDQQDLYTSHKNNSLVKDELLKAYRQQVATNEELIKTKADHIELLLRAAKDHKDELDKCNLKVEQQVASNEELIKTKADQMELLLREAKDHKDELDKCNFKVNQLNALNISNQLQHQANEARIQDLLNEAKETRKQLESYRITLQSTTEQLQSLQAELQWNNVKFEELKTNFTSTAHQLEALQVEAPKLTDQLSICKTQIESADVQLQAKTTTLNERQTQIDQLQHNLRSANTKLSEYQSEIDTLQSTNCYWFGNSSGIHKIRAPGTSPFEVLCDSRVAGPGWTVIQRRINGSENFYRNWTDYSAGFGSLHGEFFIGLEKLYRLTIAQSYELYIHLENFNNESYYARYADFTVGSASESYALKLLGTYKGTAGDGLHYARYRKFSTYDVDNDRDDGNCAEQKHGAWWYDRCGLSNLNGQYTTTPTKDPQSIFWRGIHTFSFKSVQMMLRPKWTEFS